MSHDRTDIDENLALAHRHHEAGRWQDAERLYRSVLATDPEHAEANHLLGVLAYQTGRHDLAAQLIAKAILRDGSKAAYLGNLGLVLEARNERDAALMLYRQALMLDPGFTEARLHAAAALEAAGRLDEALAEYDRVVATHPAHPDAWNGRGLVLHAQGRLEDALASFDRALALDPDFAEAHSNRGNTLEAQGRIGDAQAAYRRALAVAPDFAGAHSNLLLSLQYDETADAGSILAAHLDWGARHAREPSRPLPDTRARSPDRRLRIGYVSADFCRHPVASFVEPLLRAHDRSAFETVCYSNVRSPDEITERLRGIADVWRPIRGVPDERVADLVREDGIDILVDLSGHTAGNRLRVMALKPAPIQVTYLGYPGTTGLAAIDYRLSDVWTDPPATDDLHTERLLRLPGGSLCFEPPRAAPEPAPLADLAPGRITFASFNNAAKISPAAIALWSRVLRALPASRLLLKAKSIGDRGTADRLRRLFDREGIGAERLELAGWAETSEAHLALYGRTHVALDTFPYSGCTTTCEALWMGVPVVTLAGGEARSRMSAGVLQQSGLPELIAVTPDAFVELAVGLAEDVGRLRELRSTLRGRLQRSSLLDAAGLARRIETAYRDMWQRRQ